MTLVTNFCNYYTQDQSVSLIVFPSQNFLFEMPVIKSALSKIRLTTFGRNH